VKVSQLSHRLISPFLTLILAFTYVGADAMENLGFKVLGEPEISKICDELSYSIIANDGVPVTAESDENHCGKYFTVTDSEDNFIFVYGVIIYKEKLFESKFSEFRRFHVKTIFQGNNPQAEIEIVRSEQLNDSSYSIEQLFVAEKNNHALSDQWIHEMAIRNDGQRSIMIFVMMPRSVTSEFVNSVQRPEFAKELTDFRSDVTNWYSETKKMLN
jgi:hypothetical protein